ncbi:Transferrin receptor and related proteins containing the protease-associated (PA) domain [Phaffia rhodozyma]|uniref:Peptide hydrolase n=1 Tax=Phaffia rhodozyma TaxID=264483 RepID=A0A0F7SJZ3_PHARH|nr:Transferrin receptor and related proteins containing the protease-associated (PA) domain [Phaffia rhodozyma]
MKIPLFVVPTLTILPVALSIPLQFVASPPDASQLLPSNPDFTLGDVDRLLKIHPDPVELMKLLSPETAEEEDEPRLLRVFGRQAFWGTEGDKMRLRREGLGFMDLTGLSDETEGLSLIEGKADNYTWPDLKYQDLVKAILPRLSTSNMHSNLVHLTSFFNRFYKSPHGAESSHWVYLQVLKIVADAPAHVPLSVRKFTHPFAQSSVIARFEAKQTNHKDKVVIIGAHQDSANYRLPLLPAPGADDDGSGTVTILEAFKALVESGFTPKVPVEFHWYAAEEGGLLGSKDIVKDIIASNVDVKGMIQFDMTAFTKANMTPTVTLIDTDVTTSLTQWTVKVAKTYSSIKVQLASLFPGAGSDHMSYYQAGFPSCFATEADPFVAFDPYVHTTGDRIDLPNKEFSFEHAVEFSKLAIGFAVELGGWEQ